MNRKYSVDEPGPNAQKRRGLFATSQKVNGHIFYQQHPTQHTYHSGASVHASSAGQPLSSLFMSGHTFSGSSKDSGLSTSSSASSSLRAAQRVHHVRNNRNWRSATGSYGSGRFWSLRASEFDMEKVVNSMEKGHRVCKLLLLKKWDPSYKKLWFNRETRQIILTKYDDKAPNKTCCMSKPQMLDIMLIKDVQTLDFKIHKMKIHDKWRKDRELQRFQSDWILIVSYGHGFVLNHWILLFDSAEACKHWCQGLQHLRMEWMEASHFLIMERWLRKQFYSIVNMDTNTITIRHMKPFVQTTLQCKVQSKQLQEITEGEMGFEAFVLAHNRLQNLNFIFQKYFQFLSDENQRVTVDNFFNFVQEYQHDEIGFSKDTAVDFLRSYLREVDLCRDIPEPFLTTEEFVDFLFSRENTIFDPINHNVVHDMTQPLTNYWIASSHNTYLTGDQLKSESSLDAYAHALLMGCRCVELDCWDGQKKSSGEFSEIVIYHGYTMTTKLNLRDVLLTIKHYAFQTSDYPVILSIEDNCSVPAQRLMAKEISEVLGDLLLTQPVSKDETRLPSPSALRHKIILKHKKLQLEGDTITLAPSLEEDMETDLLSKECVKRGVLSLYDENSKAWEKHVFVLFPDRLCYVMEPYVEEQRADSDSTSQTGDDESMGAENTPSGFGVRPEEMHVTEEWFHGKVGRDEAKERLLEHKDPAGNVVYLVRESGTFIGDYTLSFIHAGKVHHCRIKTKMVDGEKKFFFLESNKKDTLYELISYYTKHTLDTPAFRSYLSIPCPQPQPHLNQPWFSPSADKKRAEELLNTVPEDGAFLIRYSSTDQNVFVLSLKVDGEFWHYRLKRDGRIFVVNQTVFENLNQVVDYYSTHDFVRGICLKFPVNEQNVGEYISEFPAQVGCYMELKDLEQEIEAVAVKDFEGIGSDDLSFQVGSRLSIIRKEPDLWKGRLDKRVGWFPPDCVKELEGESAAEMSYVTIVLAGAVVDKSSESRPFSFKVSQPTSHWKTKEVLVAADEREDMEDWISAINSMTRSVNDKMSLIRSKEKQVRIASELSALVVYCQAVPFNPDFTLQDPRSTFFEMCSFSENKHEKLLEKGLPLFNARQLSRVYPQASRLTSTNFNPVPMWSSGCHMVALNYQTGDRAMNMNEGKFMANGRCGYVLKPSYLQDETFRPDLRNDTEREGTYPITLKLTVIAGRHLSRKDYNKGICSPFVHIEMSGLPTDTRTDCTNTITSNGLNPFWNETFEFDVYRPELALIRFLVEDGDFVGPKTDPFIGQAVFPVDCLRPGFRSVPLLNQSSEPLEISSLLVFVQIRPLFGTENDWISRSEVHKYLQQGRSTVEVLPDGRMSIPKKSSLTSSLTSHSSAPTVKRNSHSSNENVNGSCSTLTSTKSAVPRLSFDVGYGDSISVTTQDSDRGNREGTASPAGSPVSPRLESLRSINGESRSISMDSEENGQPSKKPGALKRLFRFGR
ncbi:unnamed protein product [Bursaphelenchus xylophilus]|uniref:Phosphoinositide phospholipase C n=1 Tax=Bursaphelenchus xylophilus TaxID=6326 RepID=A0A1I7SCD8_BURXY|nr:unnamed protein product [Bursaphelenchus xylophilus]CAG9094281.1 unnamed protein product [Bursaphelenchus xylophilus]